MKRGILAAVLALSLLLSGCQLMNNNYVSITPHQEQKQNAQAAVISAQNYLELISALDTMIFGGTESAAINVSEYPQGTVESDMDAAVRHAMEALPVGAYAVENISFELGTSGGQPAVAVEIDYRHSRSEIRQIRKLKDMDALEAVIAKALEDVSASVVVLVEEYNPTDIHQVVQRFAEKNPQTVMETPQVSESIYGKGRARVLELHFTYQTDRDSLRQMKAQVKPVFDSAVLYVSGDAVDWQKYSQLFGFLLERFDYKLETSITPAYSLLRHGVGDSRAFATVYGAMCRAAGLECMVVTGTRSGEPWVWNIVNDNGHYYHVDLLRSNQRGRYMEMTDGQMNGYVWDYSAYPVCEGIPSPEEESEAPAATRATAPPESMPQEEPEPSEPETIPVTEPVEIPQE